MRLVELIVRLLLESNGDLDVQVKVDAGIPTPFEDKFVFKMDKGWMLLKEKDKS